MFTMLTTAGNYTGPLTLTVTVTTWHSPGKEMRSQNKNMSSLNRNLAQNVLKDIGEDTPKTPSLIATPIIGVCQKFIILPGFIVGYGGEYPGTDIFS